MRFARLLVLVVLLALVVVPSAFALRFSDGSLVPPSGVVGVGYFHKIDGEGGCNEGDYDIRVLSGSLPPGLSLVGSTTDWRIEGTPTASGSFGVWLELKGYCPWFPGDNKTAERSITINIAPGLTIDQGAVPVATLGAPYGLKLTASGGGTQRWALTGGALPTGMTLGNDGTIAGTPTAKGDFPFTVRVDDGAGRANSRNYTLAVRATLAITSPAPASAAAGGSPAIPLAEIGKPFTLPLVATGGSETFTWSVAAETPLPGGIVLDAAAKALKGVPTTAGTFPIKVTVADTEGRTASLDVRLAIAPRLAFATSKLRAAKVGKAYSAKIRATGGAGELTWRLLRVRPGAGIRFDATTGTLSFASPKVARRYTIVLRVTDELKVIANQTLTLDVTGQPKKSAKRG